MLEVNYKQTKGKHLSYEIKTKNSKLQCWNSVSQDFEIEKSDLNTHLDKQTGLLRKLNTSVHNTLF